MPQVTLCKPPYAAVAETSTRPEDQHAGPTIIQNVKHVALQMMPITVVGWHEIAGPGIESPPPKR